MICQILSFIQLCDFKFAFTSKQCCLNFSGQRLKEGGHINKSLLALGSVIAKLSEGER